MRLISLRSTDFNGKNSEAGTWAHVWACAWVCCLPWSPRDTAHPCAEGRHAERCTHALPFHKSISSYNWVNCEETFNNPPKCSIRAPQWLIRLYEVWVITRRQYAHSLHCLISSPQFSASLQQERCTGHGHAWIHVYVSASTLTCADGQPYTLPRSSCPA